MKIIKVSVEMISFLKNILINKQLKNILLFRVVVLVLFIGFTLTVVSVTMTALNVRAAIVNALKLSSMNINEMVVLLLKEVELDSMVYGDLYKASSINVAKHREVLKFAFVTIKRSPYVSGFSIIDSKTGEMYRCIKDMKNEVLVAEIKPDGSGSFTARLYENYLTSGQKLMREDKKQKDPRSLEHYEKCKDLKAPTWLDSRNFTYKIFEEFPPISSYITPLFDEHGGVLALISIDLGIDELQEFLMNKTKQESGIAQQFGGVSFVMELRDDQELLVLGHPDPRYLGKKFDSLIASVFSDRLILGDKHPDQRVRAFAELIKKDIMKRSDPFNDHFPNVKYGFDDQGVAWLFSWSAVYPGSKPRWVVGTCVNREEVVSSPALGAKIIFLSLLGIIFITVPICIYSSKQISDPIEVMARDVIEIGKGNIEYSSRPDPFASELIYLKDGIEKMKNGMLSFRKYIPYKVVNQVLASRKTAEPFAEKKELTIFFSDIENFTTISESLEPDRLVKLIGDHLAICTNIIQSLEGTIDKYIGDSVMAFWNAPENCDHHQVQCCLAALECFEKMKIFNNENKSLGLPELNMRIGINTGFVFVGNIGSDDRLNYTVIGDAVNLASRLEGANKLYKSNILISENTYLAVKHEILARPVDKLAVKGKVNAVLIYEVVGKFEDQFPQMLEIIHLTKLGFEHYLNQKFQQAMDCYQQILGLKKDDQLALFYINRCMKFLASPPPSDWDGIYISHSK